MRLCGLALVAACGGGGAGGSSGTLDPDRVQFGARTYVVTVQAERVELVAPDDKVALDLPSDRRHLAPCPRPRVLVSQVDGERGVDVIVYSCGFATIYLDAAEPMSRAVALEAKWKDGRWARIDTARYRLDDLTARLRAIDPDA